MENTQYRPVPGLHEYYRAGDDGSIWSCGRGQWKRLRVAVCRGGYEQVRLGPKGNRVTWKVHKVVLTAFVGPRPHGMEARHLNGNKLDNRLTNLVWGTQKENFDDRRRHGTVITRATAPTRKLNEAQVLAAADAYNRGEMIKDIAAGLGVDPSWMSKILRGREWRDVGAAPLAGRDARQRGALLREQRKREAKAA